MNTIVDVLKATKIFLTAREAISGHLPDTLHDLVAVFTVIWVTSNVKVPCQPRGSVLRTLISVMALSGVVKVDCVTGAERGRGEKGSRWPRGKERSHAGLPTPFYNYVEWKLRNTNFEYLCGRTQFSCTYALLVVIFKPHWQLGGQN